MAKSTRAELEQRVNKIYELLINSWNRYDILQYSREKWNIEEKQADNYIAEARKIIKEGAKQTREEFLEDCRNKLADLYKKNMSLKNLRECRQIMETANKILGYEKLNVDLTGSVRANIIFNKDLEIANNG